MKEANIDVDKYFKESQFLIIDKNAASRTRLLKILIDLGAKRQNVYCCSHQNEAQEHLTNSGLSMILCDYKIDGGSGFDLFHYIRTEYPDRKNLIQILITSNMSQNAVAKAAEEEIDTVILKPYTIDKIKEALTEAIRLKISPTTYMQKIEEGKKFLQMQNYSDAAENFREATQLDENPALALFYLGQVEYLSQNISGASANYYKGLSYNEIHFKCLLGLFDVLMNKKDFNGAYAIVRKLANYFPTNPNRLSKAIHLSVQTKHLDDMFDFYESFKELDDRSLFAINYMGAGLYVTGKYFFLNGKEADGIKAFEALAISCPGGSKFLRGIIEVLVEFDRIDKAEDFMRRFSPDLFDSEDFLIADFLLSCKSDDNPHAVMKKASILAERKIKSDLCYDLLVYALERGKIPLSKIQNFDLKECS